MRLTDTNIPPQPTVACPKCGTPVRLTEALAAPLLEATRLEFESQLQSRDEALAKQREDLKQKETRAAEAAEKLRERESQLATKTENDRVETARQRDQLAAEVARQTEAGVQKELTVRLAVEKKRIAEAEERHHCGGLAVGRYHNDGRFGAVNSIRPV